MKEMSQKMIEVEECMKIEQMSSQVKSDEIKSLENKLEFMKKEGIGKESQIRKQWEENVKTYQFRIKQK